MVGKEQQDGSNELEPIQIERGDDPKWDYAQDRLSH